MRMKKANSILKINVKKLFQFGHKYHNTNQTDKAREQKLK